MTGHRREQNRADRSGLDAEIETEDLAVDLRSLDGIELFDAGTGVLDAVGDLLALR